MNKINPKIIFMGTPEFGAIVLEELIKNDYQPILVITGPDKPVGRKQVITPPPVKVLAQKYNIPISQPKKPIETKDEIKNLNSDLIISAAYGKFIPKEILEIPRYKCLNIHPSLLPEYRGPSPLHQAILDGKKETGVTIMLIDEKMDHGPILKQETLLLDQKISYKILEEQTAKLGAQILIDILKGYIEGEIKPQDQKESEATYTKIINKEDGKINWEKSAEEIERQIRAFYIWPNAYTSFGNKILKILKADVLQQECNEPGKTLLTKNNELAIQTGKNLLIIKELQLEGKREMIAEDFLMGHKEFIGITLK